ncbi:hypothetical protein [uncultured Prevotella sp.]|uniref:hypothetical protein n=1 Tax=uncultured Prevotella sp. TaxID=159272 RepID=UPI0027E30EB7|nr:hypothetical protein [uncultured Prevotella sp.]
MNPNNIQQCQQPKKDGIEMKYATLSIVRELDDDIQNGRVTDMIEFLTNVGERMLSKTMDGSMQDRELQEYKDYFYDIDIINLTIRFLKNLNRNCPDNFKPERRCAVWGR